MLCANDAVVTVALAAESAVSDLPPLARPPLAVLPIAFLGHTRPL